MSCSYQDGQTRFHAVRYAGGDRCGLHLCPSRQRATNAQANRATQWPLVLFAPSLMFPPKPNAEASPEPSSSTPDILFRIPLWMDLSMHAVPAVVLLIGKSSPSLEGTPHFADPPLSQTFSWWRNDIPDLARRWERLPWRYPLGWCTRSGWNTVPRSTAIFPIRFSTS